VGLDPDRLVDAFRRAVERVTAGAAEAGPQPPGPRVTQAERIAAIERGLSAKRTLAFDVLLDGCRTVEDVIVTFLAVLELLKQARIRVWQLSNFGAIVLSRVPASHG
jgi:chromatin segregation and condensation protein Rec8/ScpA/Scc1 (kleisin family)